MGRVLHKMERGEMWRSDRMRGGGAIYWACTLSTGGKMYLEGRGMYLYLRINVGRAVDKMLSVSAPVWGEWSVVTYLHP